MFMFRKLFTFLALITTSVVAFALSAGAQTSVPVQTLKTTYYGYNPNTSSRLAPASRCTVKNKPIYVAKPAAPGNYPVLLYIHGTYGDLSGNVEGQSFVKEAAGQGFVAAAITYNSASTNSDSGYAGHAYCMFEQTHPTNAIATICNVPGADCSKGLLVSGFSQGAVIATIAKNYNQNVNAVWAIGLSAAILPKDQTPAYVVAAPGGTRALPNNKLVINMGESAQNFTNHLNPYDLPSLKQMTGVDCGDSYKCAQNGYGYYVVANSEVADGKADHCYWEGNSGCQLAPKNLEVGFKPPATTEWSMIRNLDWLRSQL